MNMLKYRVLSHLLFLIFYYVIGPFYPTVVIRLMDVAVFLIISSLIFLINTKENILLKFLIVSLVTLYYININFLSYESLVNTDMIYSFFKNIYEWVCVMNISAIIVTYNPSLIKVEKLVKTLLSSKVSVVIVDNNSSNDFF